MDSERDVLREYAKKVMKKIEKYKLKNEKGKRMKVYDAKSVDFEKCRYGFFC